MIGLAIATEHSVYRDLARRLRGVAVVEALESADAVIADGCEPAREAAESGKHVLLEEPLRLPLETLSGLAEACRRRGARFVPAHIWRHRPAVCEVKAALDGGKLGLPGLLRIHRWEPRGGDAREAGLSKDSAGWVEEIDLANWFFGRRPAKVYALGRERYLQVHLGFAGGGMALIDIARSLPPGSAYASLSLLGSTGAAYADDHDNIHLLLTGGPPRAIRTGQGEADRLGQLYDFIGAIREDRLAGVTVAATQTALEVSEAVRSSAESRQVVDLSEDVHGPT